MDVTSLSSALQNLSTDDGSDGSFTQLVLAGLNSPEALAQRSTVQSLHSLLTEGLEEECLARQRAVFGEHALDYLPIFFNVFPVSLAETSRLILLCAEHSSAREAILALSEACSGIEERFFGYMVSDDEDEDGEHGAHGKGATGAEAMALDQAQVIIPQQLRLLFQALAIAFTRMPNIKSTPTLLTLADTLESALIHLSGLTAEAGDDAVAAAALGMIEKAWEWVRRSTDAGGEQRAILSQLFYLSISLFSPLAHDSLRRWFTARYPKYAQLRRQHTQAEEAAVSALSADGSPAQHPFNLALETASVLKLDPQTLVDNIAGTSVGSRVSPHASFASLILLSHRLASNATSNGSDDAQMLTVDLPPLSDILTLLTAALGSTAVDAGLTCLWEIVSRATVGDVDADEAEQLVETLFPLSATHPDPLIRLAVWKLVCEMVHKVSAPEGKLQLFKQLLEPTNPFAQIRMQALVLLRQELSDAVRQPKGTSTILSPVIFSLPLMPDSSDVAAALAPPPTTPITASTDMYPDGPTVDAFGPPLTLYTEQLVLLRFLYELDEASWTGIREAPRRLELRDSAILPAKQVLSELKVALGQRDQKHQGEEDVMHGFGEAFAVERLEGVIGDLEAAMA